MRTRTRNLACLLAAGLVLGAAGCGGDAGGGGGGKDAASGKNAKVTITVGCQPPKSNKIERQEWDEDVAAFEKLHPDIDIESKDAFPCINPETFQAKLAGGTMEDVFYVYYTDVKKIIQNRQAADISPYVGTLKNYAHIRPDVMSVFKDGDKVYGVPRNTYSMGLVYNRKLFSQAGLNPDAPPKTWAEVREAAKKIAGLGGGVVGFGEYSAGNTGGWHFTASLYARGGDVVTPDGTKAAFNSAEGKAVLENLKQMRWTDNSMGTKQLHQWEDLMRLMGSGKLGMMIGAPDVVQAVNNDFRGKYEDYGVAAVPEAKASLAGGDGYMFHPKATPEKIRAGLLWLEYLKLTPGKGQFDYERGKRLNRPVGLPYPDFYAPGTPPGDQILADREKFATVPVEHFTSYVEASPNIPNKLEPPKAQELYALLDKPMSAVLTNRDANIDQLLAEAASKADQVLSKG
ncbi:ABC transporter substrate-binding protein [Bailinhaonella thermotolerans]|uniref:Extracellular solute-binding protein n=1 Tax=Bailinhaonella thermotolerans TaxID=1070861 RepID=A0A3A4AWM8_9ACTN|nr:extracellular solute-binding protein [Bailinhaonella thermotolerans]RJL32697.1 extracellular solute-binding protein [Bailinhaonella thermotolerans]